jgi:hypothetical protein
MGETETWGEMVAWAGRGKSVALGKALALLALGKVMASREAVLREKRRLERDACWLRKNLWFREKCWLVARIPA